MGAEGRLDHRIDQVVGDHRLFGVIPDRLRRDDFLGADEQPPRGARHLGCEAADPVNLGVSVHIGPVDMDQADVQDERRQQAQQVTRERTLHHLGRAVAERIGAQHRANREEGDPHRRGLETPGKRGIGPLHALLDPPALDFPAQSCRDAVHLQPDVGDVERLDQPGGQEQIRLEHALASQPQLANPLAHDLARERHRAAHAAIQFRPDVITAMDEGPHGFRFGHAFIHECLGFCTVRFRENHR